MDFYLSFTRGFSEASAAPDPAPGFVAETDAEGYCCRTRITYACNGLLFSSRATWSDQRCKFALRYTRCLRAKLRWCKMVILSTSCSFSRCKVSFMSLVQPVAIANAHLSSSFTKTLLHRRYKLVSDVCTAMPGLHPQVASLSLQQRCLPPGEVLPIL